MVIIDDVYQKVLAIANKEQRGYITPQEFNLFADQAQIEIFEQYFYDLNQQARIHGNEYVYADVDDMLEEKIQIFEKTDLIAIINTYAIAPNTGGRFLPDYVYRVGKIEFNGADCEILKTKDFNNCINSGPLIRPNDQRPIANIRDNVMRVVGGTSSNPTLFRTPTSLIYLKRPANVSWGYYVVGLKALHDPNPAKTKNFELHKSDETELVYKILTLAGISMRRDDVTQAAAALQTSQIQQEKQ
tara:strand:+ start:176 stop:907 length:732 start_codon:yes stop_codon:yes gene_type:complete